MDELRYFKSKGKQSRVGGFGGGVKSPHPPPSIKKFNANFVNFLVFSSWALGICYVVNS